MSAHIYSASGKYSQRFTFSTFCYVIALFQNGWNSLFSSKFYKQYPIMTMWKKFVWNLCKFIKIKKRKKSHVHKYSQPLLNTLLKHLWHQLQPQIFLGMMLQALLIIIWQLSAILLLSSSPLKLCQVGWVQMHIFRFLQKYLIGSIPGWGWATQGHSQSCL